MINLSHWEATVHTGIEPVFLPWQGSVIAVRPMDQKKDVSPYLKLIIEEVTINFEVIEA